jgi:hypoxanthine phosphoribosyltransferase
MAMLRDKAELYIAASEIEKLCSQLALQINHDYKEKELILICVLKGSVLFTADLVRKITIPVKIDFVRLSSYGHGTESTGNVQIIKDVSFDLRDKHVLVIEDILDTGTTLDFFKKHLQASKPASLKIATLLDKPSRRKKAIEADYCGKKIEDHFVVGYGLDLGEKCRNYGDIWYFKN